MIDSLEEKLKMKITVLYMKLDSELEYIDRKEMVHEMKLRSRIDRIEGFLLGMYYMRSKYSMNLTHSMNKDTLLYETDKVNKFKDVPKSSNSILDNQKDYLGD